MSTEGMVPMFEVDPLFPKSVGNHWLQGPIIGVDVDSKKYVQTVTTSLVYKFNFGGPVVAKY